MQTVNLASGSKVRVASGPHEGRSGTIVDIREPKISYTDPEPYAIIDFVSDIDTNTGKEIHDEIAVPVRRLQPH